MSACSFVPESSIWLKSKIREKTDLGAWGRDKPSRKTGEDCLAVSPRSERSVKRPTIEGKRVNERGWVAGSTCLQWKQVYATLPYPTTSIPPPPKKKQKNTHTQPIDLFPPFSLSNGFTEVQSTVFQLCTLIFSRAVHCGVT